MHRIIASLLASLAIVALAGPVAAAGSASNYHQTGPGARAVWSTCPGGPTPSVPCTETFMLTGAAVVREGATRWDDRFLALEQFTFVCDDAGDCRIIATRSAFAGPDEIDFVLDPVQLRFLSVTATPLVVTCVFDDDDFVCGDWEQGSISASWDATGDPQRGSQNYNVTSECFVEIFHARGTTRAATAVGSMDGRDFGVPVFGQLFNGMYAAQTIRHTCPFPPEAP